ncbi:hypothetical protein Q5424_01725 [Conexibacter sp. JD483]|uniref:hypothetical protein n=1 Tax=unclassified Conexibacter TaxID=2627773 RepID=UPI0027165F5D|nr:MULTISPECIES: hypothetical protein [unclassified Conexibacter]MDO8185215.1 hypothetical protein [Conexibacter sp. CPCC 205706]MDO8198261.1 hypothetical protein [Conexibacter sp. CPCC 205762]MDR9367777.1 hypothetical protein [Conexibacter sp. JD483]
MKTPRKLLAAAVASTMIAGAVAAPSATAGDAGTYTHWESITCQSGQFYRNYNAGSDSFSDPYGATLPTGTRVQIRDEPYRREGSRGVRAYQYNAWGYFSINCL